MNIGDLLRGAGSIIHLIDINGTGGGLDLPGLAAYLLGGALMVFGAVELLRRLSFWLQNAGGPPEREKDVKSGMALVLIPSGPEECEGLIRAGGLRREWMALRPPCRLICLDSGGPEARAIAERLAGRYQGLELCSAEELAGLLTGEERKDR